MRINRPASGPNRRVFRQRATLKRSAHLAHTRRSDPPRVALIVETSTSFGRRLLCGIAEYIRENAPWSVYFGERSVYDPVPPWLKKWAGDGIIARVASPEIAEVVANMVIPIVDLEEQLRGLGVPLISNDHRAIGRLAAEHLLQVGLIVRPAAKLGS